MGKVNGEIGPRRQDSQAAYGCKVLRSYWEAERDKKRLQRKKGSKLLGEVVC